MIVANQPWYVEHHPVPRWRNRLQITYSGSRDEFGASTAFGEGRVESLTLIDFVTAIRFPRGTLTVGIENLANAAYVPPINQAFNDGFNYIAGRGRTIRVNVALPWTR